MKKIFDLTKISKFRYALKSVYKNGIVVHYPVVKEPGILSTWRPIVKVYEEYVVLDYEYTKGFSKTECREHIEGFQEQLKKLLQQQYVKVEYKEYPVSNEDFIPTFLDTTEEWELAIAK